jgi:tyrosyl-tRNA synthetase
MYRYYELLTDASTAEIASLRAQEPMPTKMELGRRIVTDFHSQVDADAAVKAFDREVRQGLEPADTETVNLPAAAISDKGIRVDKLLAQTGLADSVTDAARKLKAGAVEINGEIYKELLLTVAAGILVIRVGKKWKRIET